MNKENYEEKLITLERNVKGTTNKDVGENPDRWTSAVTRQAQTQQYVQATRGPSAGKHISHSIRIWF